MSEDRITLFKDRITQGKITLVLLSLELDRILGEGHPFILELYDSKYLKNGIISINNKEGDPLGLLELDEKGFLSEEYNFEKEVESALEIHLLFEKYKGEKRKFVSPQNQLKPFLTPMQEVTGGS